jgi:uncharacterized membrane protein
MDSDSTQKSSLSGISSYTLSAGLAGLGLLETGYLSYLKFTGSSAFCPIGGGSCGDVLNSDYSLVFGNCFLLVSFCLFKSGLLFSNSLDLYDY